LNFVPHILHSAFAPMMPRHFFPFFLCALDEYLFLRMRRHSSEHVLRSFTESNIAPHSMHFLRISDGIF